MSTTNGGIVTNLRAGESLVATAPCRVDMGGTLDLSTFYLAIPDAAPSTVNLALDMRTRVIVAAGQPGRVRVASAGFDTAEFPTGDAPYEHPLGLMFAVVDHFQADGVAVAIHSTSPPRSALGGSSVAAVALIAALDTLQARRDRRDPRSSREIAMMAHRIESGVAGVPCGMQDQLAAAFGGVHQWCWRDAPDGSPYVANALATSEGADVLDAQVLVAYCGVPHVSRDINGRWVREFIAGRGRDRWRRIAALTRAFADAVSGGDPGRAVVAMNEETDIRMEMTPDVVDAMGRQLVADARTSGCGARFTGAGGGGCIWAMGPADAIERTAAAWSRTTADHPDATLLSTRVDWQGVDVHWASGDDSGATAVD